MKKHMTFSAGAAEWGAAGYLHPAAGSEVCVAPFPVAQPFIHWVGVNRCDVQALGQAMQL